MKTTVHGDIITLTLEGIKFDALAKLFPEGVTVTNEKDHPQYMLKAGNFLVAGLDKYGATANQKNAQGDTLIQLVHVGSPKEFIASNADALTALKQNETAIKDMVDARGTMIKDLEDSIVVD